ncbi:hypothetical protein WICPIJ_000471 [Wickerhamomyces pijperi]|uniref:Zn(2)-C6 fungal-type domain-containing protein n=1 Tax=Wickerhamomyces pijperi TaxID=599730 RepID=A0A9P8TRW8_WICPI|nr:hypothetical protein WICPIJ_000471 [Wickerhamomyces pijperi]
MSNISHIISAVPTVHSSGPDNPANTAPSEGASVNNATSTNGLTHERDEPQPQPQPHLLNEPDTADEESQRKRSKASRACDECRRKKVKCDAMMTGNNTLEKPCTNCIKNGDQCLFERIQMKRGPTKGFGSSNRSRSNSRSSRHSSISSMQSLQSMQSGSTQIVLPPLTSLTVPIDNHPSAPASPRGLSNPQLQQLQQQQQQSQQQQQLQQQPQPPQAVDYTNAQQQQQSGLFWKVPSSFNRRGSNVSMDSNMSNDRYSVSSAGSGFNPQFRTKSYEASVISDSEEESSRMMMGVSLGAVNANVYNSASLPFDARGQAVLLDNYYKLVHPINPILIEREPLIELLNRLEPSDINQVLVNFLYHSLDLLLNNNQRANVPNTIMTINQLYWKVFQLYQTYQNILSNNLGSLYLYITTLLVLNVKLFNLRDFDSINLNFTNILVKKFRIFSKLFDNNINPKDTYAAKTAEYLKFSYLNICYLNALTSLIINSEKDGLNIVRFDFKEKTNDSNPTLPLFAKFLLNFNSFKQSIFKDFNYNKESIYSNYIGLIQSFLNDKMYSQLFEAPGDKSDSSIRANIDTNFFRLIRLNYELIYRIDQTLKAQPPTATGKPSKSEMISFIDQSQYQLYETINQQLSVLKYLVPLIINGDGSPMLQNKDQQSSLMNYSSLSILLLNKSIDLIKLQQIFLNVFKINSQLSFKISMNFNDLINLIQMIPNFNTPTTKFDSNSLQFFVNLNIPNTLTNLDLSLVQLIYQNYRDLLKDVYNELLEGDLKYGWGSK